MVYEREKKVNASRKACWNHTHVSGFLLTCLCVRPHCRCWSLFSWVLCVLMRISTAKVSHHLKPDCLFVFGESVVRWDYFILGSLFSLCPHNLLPCPNRVVYEYVLMWHLLCICCVLLFTANNSSDAVGPVGWFSVRFNPGYPGPKSRHVVIECRLVTQPVKTKPASPMMKCQWCSEVCFRI